MKEMVPVGANKAGLCVPVAVLLAEGVGLVPQATGGGAEAGRHSLRGDVRGRLAVLLDDGHERRPVLLELDERAAVVAGHHGALAVRLGGHDRGDRGGVGLPGRRVVGQAAAHEQRAEVGIAQAERPEAVAVLLDLRRRVAGVVDEDLLGRDRQAAAVAEVVDVELAVVADERHEVERRQVAVVGDQALGDERVRDRLGDVVDRLDAVGRDRGDRHCSGILASPDERSAERGIDLGLLRGRCREPDQGHERARGLVEDVQLALGVGATFRMDPRRPAGDAKVGEEQLDGPQQGRCRRSEHDLGLGSGVGRPDRTIGREEALEVGDLQVVGDAVHLRRHVLVDRRALGHAVAILEQAHEGRRL